MADVLMPHQVTAAAFLAARGPALLWDDMGCVDGAAIVQVNRRSKGQKMTLAALFTRWQKWDHTFPTTMRALCNGELRQHEIANVIDKGAMSVVKLTLHSGKTIRLTPDHEVACPENSWVSAGLLVFGSRVLTNGVPTCLRCGSTESVVTSKYARVFRGYCRTCIYRYLRKDKWHGSGKHLDKDGYVRVSGQWGHPRCSKNGNVPEHILVVEASLGRHLNSHEQVHHKNENTSDNELSNLEVLTVSEHHYRHNRHLNMNGGTAGTGGDIVFLPKEDIVASVEWDGEARVYDVVMAGEHRNFVANGIIVHNCGKTASAIAGADLAKCDKVLVCCPAAVRPTWAREFERWQTIKRPIFIVEGHPKTPPGSGVTIISHAAFANGPSVELLRQAAPYDVIITDEIHFARQYDAARTRNLLGLGDGAWRWSFRFWGLTGTPIVNSAADLWPVLAGPFYYGETWWNYVNHFAKLKADGITPTGLRNAPELAALLRPHVLRRTLDSIGIDLPSLTINQVGIEIDIQARAAAMAELENWTPARLQAVIEANDEIKDGALSRVRHAIGIAKIVPVATYAWDLMQQNDGPIVLFFQHTEVRSQLHKILTHWGFKVSWIDGHVTPKQLGAAEAWFQEGKIDILLAQTQAAGQGLTLTRANTCIIGEMSWTAVSLQQAIKRIHRITQTRPCTAHVLRAKGCWLEEIMASITGRKQRASDELLGMLTSAT